MCVSWSYVGNDGVANLGGSWTGSTRGKDPRLTANLVIVSLRPSDLHAQLTASSRRLMGGKRLDIVALMMPWAVVAVVKAGAELGAIVSASPSFPSKGSVNFATELFAWKFERISRQGVGENKLKEGQRKLLKVWRNALNTSFVAWIEALTRGEGKVVKRRHDKRNRA